MMNPRKIAIIRIAVRSLVASLTVTGTVFCVVIWREVLRLGFRKMDLLLPFVWLIAMVGIWIVAFRMFLKPR